MQWMKNAKMNTKLLLMILIPLLGVLYFSVNAIVERYQHAQSMGQLQERTGLTVRINDVIHEIQRERGLVAGLYGTGSSISTGELRNQREETDRVLGVLRNSLQANTGEEHGGGAESQLAKALSLLELLGEERERIDNKTSSQQDALAYYEDVQLALFTVMEALGITDTDAVVSRLLTAYIQFSKGKYAVSRERTLFNRLYSDNRISHEDIVEAYVLENEQEQYYSMFASLVEPAYINEFKRLVRGQSVTETDRMIRETLSVEPGQPLNIDPSYWFAMATEKIDLYKTYEQYLSEALVKLMGERREAAISSLIGVVILNLAILGASLIMITVLSRMMLRPIRELTASTERILQGETDLHVEVRSRDEVGELTHAFNEMVASSRSVISQADRISQGDYELSITPRSDKDRLSMALTEMLQSLKETKRENEQQFWLKTQLARLTGLSQGVENLEQLVSMLVSEISSLVEAGQGVFYVRRTRKSGEGGVEYVLLGSYAYMERKHLATRFGPGEGLVGQCALEKKPILLTQVPGDYVQITSGLGARQPETILVLPILFEDETAAVLELSSFRSFTPIERDLLEQLSSALGVIIQSVVSRQRTEELLRESQLLAEELQTQQEELRTANEELEEQTRMLKLSEEKLKIQSEELQTINEELEEKTNYLELQKSDIERQNHQIELARADLEKKAGELELASRYKSEFLANMSHELRTPLNSLLILAKSLAANDEGNLTEEQMESARIIHSGGLDLLTLINDILDLSKVEAGKLDIHPAEVRISGILEHLKYNFTHLAREKELEFVLEASGALPETLVTDEQRVEQILKNLLSNAFKFTAKGRVSVRFYPAAPGTAPVTFMQEALAAGGAVAMEVSDTGIGIAGDKQQAIFEAFQQADGSTSRRYGGTGLGLTISRELAKLLGGEIHLRSTVGEGSTFTLYLPLNGVRGSSPEESTAAAVPAVQAIEESAAVPDAEQPSAAVAPPVEPVRVFLPDDRDRIVPGEDKIILIVEDDPEFARILMKLSRKKGFHVLAAGDGFSALQLAGQYMPAAVLLDLGLPDMNGLRVLDHLKFHADTRHIPVHIVSGSEESTASLQRGAIGFLSKPAAAEDIDVVFSRIEHVMSEEIKQVLVVEDDASNQRAIHELLKHKKIAIQSAYTGQEALERLRTNLYDCVILDLKLPDMTGFELLQEMVDDAALPVPPIIINTGQELTQEEFRELGRFTDSIVIKGVNSPERLLDEVSLFLHSVQKTLPPQQKQQIRAGQLTGTGGSLEGRKILLVDDDLRNTFALSKVLRQQGLGVIMADNGKLALDKLESEEGIELVIMDIMMPVMDGFEAMRHIRDNPKHRSLPIIALTAKAMSGDREKCIEGGANDYMTKPVDTDKLLSLIRVWLYNT